MGDARPTWAKPVPQRRRQSDANWDHAQCSGRPSSDDGCLRLRWRRNDREPRESETLGRGPGSPRGQACRRSAKDANQGYRGANPIAARTVQVADGTSRSADQVSSGQVRSRPQVAGGTTRSACRAGRVSWTQGSQRRGGDPISRPGRSRESGDREDSPALQRGAKDHSADLSTTPPQPRNGKEIAGNRGLLLPLRGRDERREPVDDAAVHVSRLVVFGRPRLPAARDEEMVQAGEGLDIHVRHAGQTLSPGLHVLLDDLVVAIPPEHEHGRPELLRHSDTVASCQVLPVALRGSKKTYRAEGAGLQQSQLPFHLGELLGRRPDIAYLG